MPVLPERDVINQLISGHYADPFSLLGMHVTENGLQICALLPDAGTVWLVESKTGNRLVQLNCDDARGFFSALVPRRKTPFRYQLEVSWRDHQQLLEDPYRFGTLLQDIDSWLLAEGTHLRPYERLGRILARWIMWMGSALPFGHRMPSACRSWGSSTFGMDGVIPCACEERMGFGSCFYRA